MAPLSHHPGTSSASRIEADVARCALESVTTETLLDRVVDVMHRGLPARQVAVLAPGPGGRWLMLASAGAASPLSPREPQVQVASFELEAGTNGLLAADAPHGPPEDVEGCLAACARLLQTALERIRAEHGLVEGQLRLSLTHEVARALLQAQPPSRVVSSVLDRLTQIYPTSGVAFAPLGSDGLPLPAVLRGALAPGWRLPAFSAGERASLEAGRTVSREVPSGGSVANGRSSARAPERQAVVCAPVRHAGRLAGVLALVLEAGPERPDTALLGDAAEALAMALAWGERETQRETLERSLQRAETVAALGNLVAGVAHEVRNPLFTLSATLDAIEMRLGPRDDLTEHVTHLRQSVSRLSRLMQDLLDYGRPRSRDPRPWPLCDVASQAIHACEAEARRRKVLVQSTLTRDLPAVGGDRARLVQALTAVLENAVAHARERGSVVISSALEADAGGRYLVCRVHDDGPGFSREDLRQALEPFYTRRRGATGLGLSIADRIVRDHEGRLEIGNAPDGGAVVTLRLPVAAPGLP